MDQSALVASGHTLVRAMDAAGYSPRFAMWVFNNDTQTYKLWLVPPAQAGSSQQVDKHEFYRKLAVIISEAGESLSGLDASDTELVLENHRAVQGISKMFGAPGLSTIQLSGNQMNGYYLPDGILLRSNFS